jgi:hypothetical protein
LARTFLTWSRLGAAATLLLAAAAACSGSNSSPTVTATAAPTAVPSGATASPTTGPTPAVIGVAYLPDGGNGAGFTGIQVVHFEDVASNLLPSPAYSATPTPVSFAASAGPLAFSVDGTVAVAALGSGGTYTQIQGIFGVPTSNLVPAGPPYVTTVPPTPLPDLNATAAPSPTPQADAVVANVRGITILGGGISAAALLGGNNAGTLAVSSLTQLPPLFVGYFAYDSSTSIAIPAGGTHSFITSANITSGGKDSVGNTIVGNALVRGSDLFAMQVTVVRASSGAGYGLRITAENPTLGVNPVSASQQSGHGAMAFSPADPSRALIAQSGTNANQVALVTGLPTAINVASTISLPTRPHSVAIASGGKMAVVGADDGYYVFGGIDTGTLVPYAQLSPAIYGPTGAPSPNQPAYIGPDGVTHNLVNITSVAFSADGKFLAVLGSLTANSTGGGTNASLVALPFNQTAGAAPTPVPAGTIPPQSFTQNNIYVPAVDQDLMVVR